MSSCLPQFSPAEFIGVLSFYRNLVWPNQPVGSHRNASLSQTNGEIPDLSAFIVGFRLGFRLFCSFRGGVKLAQTQLTDFSNLLVQRPLRLFSVFIKPRQ